MEMPGLNGLDVAKTLEETKNPVRVLVLSAHDDHEYMTEVLNSGASGYILKDEAFDQLVDAIHRAASGGKVVSPRVDSSS